MEKIAAILTVYNRREKTLACLRHLFEALEDYNQRVQEQVELSVFLTDDGCTDGTAEAVVAEFTGKDIHVLQGTGSLFWAGGMRFAWEGAIDSGVKWDYFLLLNDDTYIYKNVFDELFEADSYGFEQTGQHGLSSGIACQPGNKDEITYGGLNFVSKAKGRQELVQPTGIPQRIDMTHANILLVHRSVVDRIGIFHKGYRHGSADIDYSMMASRHGISTFSTPHVCGECEWDHDSNKGEIERLMKMTLGERKKYVNSPTHSDFDYLLFVRRNLPLRYPIALLLRAIRIYCPKLYYRITRFRGVYQSQES